MEYLKIPTKIIVQGDTVLGRKLIGEAKSQLNILINQMKFQGLSQSWRTVRYGSVVIECLHSFGRSVVRITVPPIPAGGKKPGDFRECFCTCSFAFGYILQPTNPGDEFPSEEYKYTVEICNTKNLYVIYDNCLASDFFNYGTNYPIPVIILIENGYGQEGANVCCGKSDRTSNDITACCPREVSEDLPTYRIIPITFPESGRFRKVSLDPKGCYDD